MFTARDKSLLCPHGNANFFLVELKLPKFKVKFNHFLTDANRLALAGTNESLMSLAQYDVGAQGGYYLTHSGK